MSALFGNAESGLELLDLGVGIFDKELYLTYCNPAFVTLRRYSNKLCQPGVNLKALLRFNAERGDFGPGDPDTQVAARIAEITSMPDRQVEHQTADGLHLRIQYQREVVPFFRTAWRLCYA